MFNRIELNNDPFKSLEKRYNAAVLCLSSLQEKYPEHNDIWNIVAKRMKIIKNTLDSKIAPSASDIRQADISTMLNYKLQNEKDIDPLFNLDKEYALFGLKDNNLTNRRENK